MKYIKTVPVEAWQWTYKNISNNIIPVEIKNAVKAEVTPFSFSIQTLEGVMTFGLGDYIAKGIQGELYPIKKEIFEKTYKPTEGNNKKTNLYIITWFDCTYKEGKEDEVLARGCIVEAETEYKAEELVRINVISESKSAGFLIEGFDIDTVGFFDFNLIHHTI